MRVLRLRVRRGDLADSAATRTTDDARRRTTRRDLLPNFAKGSEFNVLYTFYTHDDPNKKKERDETKPKSSDMWNGINVTSYYSKVKDT